MILNNTSPKYNGIKIIHFGALNNVEVLKPLANTFCESQLEWLDQMSTIPSFAQARN